MTQHTFNTYISQALSHGAAHASVISVSDITFQPELREACKQNHCGNYNRNWTCPPGIGDIHTLIDKLKNYTYALVFQTITELEDSFDFEGMVAAGNKHQQLVLTLRNNFNETFKKDFLILGAGGCPLCTPCALVANEPCRHPDEALSSLEAHGIQVSLLAESAQMNYINGADTVTYFGALFF